MSSGVINEVKGTCGHTVRFHPAIIPWALIPTLYLVKSLWQEDDVEIEE